MCHRDPKVSRKYKIVLCVLGAWAVKLCGNYVTAGFTVKTQIPLNPPLLKGDFKTPL
jgi:hypothetical protein